MKRLLAALLMTTVLVTTVMGCSGAEESSSDGQGGTSADEAITINIGWFGGEDRHEKINQILDMYTEMNPNVTFVRQYAAYGDYFTKLATQAATNTMPDCFMILPTYKMDFYSRDVMEPLQPYVDSGQLDVSDVSQTTLDACSCEGELTFISAGDTVSSLIYDETIIEEAGMELPWPDMTYSEYVDYCKELQSKLPEGVWATNYNWEHNFENHVRQHGYELISDDGKELGYPKEVVVSFFELYQELLDAGCGPTPEAAAENVGKQWLDSLEGTGRIALWRANINQLIIYQGQTDHKLGGCRGLIADDATHKYVEMVNPSGWAVSKNSPYKEEVVDFINWFTHDEEVQTIFNMDLGVPASKAIQDMILSDLDVENDLVDNSVQVVVDVVNEVLSDVEPHPGRKEGAAAIVSDIDAKWNEIMFGRMTIEEAVDAHFNDAKTILQ